MVSRRQALSTGVITSFSFSFSVTCLSALLWSTQASATLLNITVDDAYRDPLVGDSWIVYDPYSAWNAGACDGCVAPPEPPRAHLATWHESVYEPGQSEPMTASLSFEGVAVYVFCILSNTAASNISFLLDGAPAGTYVRTPASPGADADAFSYHVPVYTNTSLAAGPHTITIQHGVRASNSSTSQSRSASAAASTSATIASASASPSASASQRSLLLLDYIVYTRDNTTQPVPPTFTQTLSPESTSTSPPSANPSSAFARSSVTVGAAVGIALGGGLMALFVGALALRYWRRFRERRAERRLPPSMQYLRSVGAGAGGLPTPVSAGGESMRFLGAGEGRARDSSADASVGAGPSTLTVGTSSVRESVRESSGPGMGSAR